MKVSLEFHMRGFLLLPLVVAVVHCDTLYFRPRENPAVPGTPCQDGKSFCLDGSTCCIQESGEYGCCPLANKLLLKSASVVCPDGQSACISGSTCCKLSTGQYGCCPLPKAVCCSDGINCCPDGYTCTSYGYCTRGGSSQVTDWVKKQPALLTSGNVVCPGGQAMCPSGQTCCKLSTGQYGCCPLPKAVCCSDGKNCCPDGYTCTSYGYCTRGGSSEVTDWVKKQPALLTSENVVCPGGQVMCPSGQTCCKLSTGQYGCCPFPKAVCCSDGKNCCPDGYTCTSYGYCTRGGSSQVTDWVKKQPALLTSGNVVCPGGQAMCPSGNTCCKLSTGQYGCCPLPKAVCCSDGKHCCPNGYTCIPGACTKGGSSQVIKWVEKQPALLTSEYVVCPGGQVGCYSGSTCCKLFTGEYGCCPVPKAVCCSDGKHCCPNGYTCIPGACTKGGSSQVMKWVEKQPALLTSENVVCPGGKKMCTSGSTCCKLFTGEYGCCPLPKAVCCSDGKHCCPNGYTCIPGACTKGGSSQVMKWVEKQPALLTSEYVVCPGGQVGCYSGSTCCKLFTGEYGCCPVPKAVCCSDGKHCCPNGYTCIPGACTKGGSSQVMKWVEKQPALLTSENVVCPGGKKMCTSGSTCCKLFTGEYGCCPLPKAVCCSDGKHCCPNGYTCIPGACTKGGSSQVMKWVEKQPALLTSEYVVCPGGQVGCYSGSTCCKLFTGEYGCCPVPKAVCCSDGKHCCPDGYTCTSYGYCTRGGSSEVTDWVKKQPALLTSGNVVCPGGQVMCPSGQTCCKLSTGQYGCCPFPKAVCCSDGKNCCPDGYTCTSYGYCTRGGSSQVTDWVKKQPALLISESVVCPDGQHECKTGQTCCKLSSGGYGCCPVPN
ncbi:progranulin-like [Saccostrea cucullata]|uniref:progranulin-like n=1 Tax=Saccostrea cuccullata TaxID=36930 RepID=UPI002ED40A45